MSTTLYDPRIGAGIAALMRPNTRVVYVESPGSETFEIQDIPAIAEVAHRQGAHVVMDNTWGTPLFYKPFEHGVDVSIQAATKYIVGHSDAMLGIATCTAQTWPLIKQAAQDLGQTTSPDDAYLALRGLRTLGVRLRQHHSAGLEVARWLEGHDAIEAVLHPALPSHPGHALWQRDFLGACGLFSVVLKTTSVQDMHGFVDALQLFGLGVSWAASKAWSSPSRQAATTPPRAGPGAARPCACTWAWKTRGT